LDSRPVPRSKRILRLCTFHTETFLIFGRYRSLFSFFCGRIVPESNRESCMLCQNIAREPLLHRVGEVPVRCKDGDHGGHPFLIIAMRELVDMSEDVAVVPMDDVTGCMSRFCRGVMAVERMGYVGDLLVPDGGQDLVMGLKLVNPDHLSPHLATRLVVDQHPVAFELPADTRPRRVDRTGKPSPIRIFPHEDAPFSGRSSCFGVGFCELISDFIGKLGQHVDRKDLIRNAIPAIVIPLRELPFDFYELAKTYAALPAPVAIKLRHDL
jgi:hypothetical protein